MDLLDTCRVDPVHQFPPTRAYGVFAKGTVLNHLIFSHVASLLFPVVLVGCLPRPSAASINSSHTGLRFNKSDWKRPIRLWSRRCCSERRLQTWHGSMERTVPLENSQISEPTRIILVPEFILRCLFLSLYCAPPWVRSSVHGPNSNWRTWPCVSKSMFFAAPSRNDRN